MRLLRSYLLAVPVVLLGAVWAQDAVYAALPASPYDPMAFNEDVSVDGFQSNTFAWDDRSGATRTAALVKNDRVDPKGHHGGYARQFTYMMDTVKRTVNGAIDEHPGFGFVVNHYGSSGTSSHGVTGTYQALLRGRHHAIHQYKWRMNAGGAMDVTVQWFFATGRDHPIYAITYDCSPAGRNVINADTRSPYGDMNWDGGAGSNVAGVGWGDRYRFRSLGSPITLNNGWDYSQANLVPHVLEYSASVDAEMGLVQTQTYLQHDAGGYWFYSSWGQTDTNGPMPEDWNWTYQLDQYELPWGSTSKRLAWGANYGAVGQASYMAYGDDKSLVGYPYQSYAVFVVLDRHSLNAVDAQVAEIEQVQKVSLSATVGSVATSGPAGIGRSDTATYQPVGYNPIYSAWELKADSQSKTAFRFSLSSGTLANPIFLVKGFTASAPPSTIKVNGATKTADQDFYASLDTANATLWLTLKGSFTGATDVSVDPSSVPPPLPAPRQLRLDRR